MAEDGVYYATEPMIYTSQLGQPGGPAVLDNTGTLTCPISIASAIGDASITSAKLAPRDASLLLHPQYPNSVLSAGSGVTAAYYVPTLGGAHYYSFRKTSAPMSTSTIGVRINIPDDFVNWGSLSGGNDVNLVIRTELANNSKGWVSVLAWDTAGQSLTLTGDAGQQFSSIANTNRTLNLNFSGGTFTPGGTMTVQVSAATGGSGTAPLGTLVGPLTLNYRKQ